MFANIWCLVVQALEMTRKVVLTGLMVFFAPGTVQQLLLGSTISAAYMCIAIWKQPYVSCSSEGILRPASHTRRLAVEGAMFVFTLRRET